MKYAHHIEMRVFCKEGEDEKGIVDKIHELFPMDFEKEKIEFTRKSAESFDGNRITIFTVFVKKERQTTIVLKNLFSHLDNSQIDLLKQQLESRLDDKLHFYIRLEKKELLLGNYQITDSGDCFHINISIAAYPHKRTVARKTVEKLLEKRNI